MVFVSTSSSIAVFWRRGGGGGALSCRPDISEIVVVHMRKVAVAAAVVAVASVPNWTLVFTE